MNNWDFVPSDAEGQLKARCINYVKWLNTANIKSGPVFRGFWRSGNKVRENRLSANSVNALLNKYPLTVDGGAAGSEA